MTTSLSVPTSPRPEVKVKWSLTWGQAQEKPQGCKQAWSQLTWIPQYLRARRVMPRLLEWGWKKGIRNHWKSPGEGNWLEKEWVLLFHLQEFQKPGWLWWGCGYQHGSIQVPGEGVHYLPLRRSTKTRQTWLQGGWIRKWEHVEKQDRPAICSLVHVRCPSLLSLNPKGQVMVVQHCEFTRCHWVCPLWWLISYCGNHLTTGGI